MRDLGTQTAKSNATKTLQAAAVGAGVGAVAGTAVSNNSTETTSAQPRAASQNYGYNQSSPTYQSGSPPVVNNHYETRNSNGDLLTGVMLGQAMSNNSNRERANQYNQPAPATQNSTASNSMDPYSGNTAGVAPSQQSSGMGFFGFLMVIILLAGLGALAYAVYNARSAKLAKAQLTKGRYTL